MKRHGSSGLAMMISQPSADQLSCVVTSSLLLFHLLTRPNRLRRSLRSTVLQILKPLIGIYIDFRSLDRRDPREHIG